MTERPCPTCGGRGKVGVTGVYAETLDILRRHPRLNAAQLARLTACSGQAMANRLVALERMGLTRGRRCGRQRIWEAVG